MMHWMKTQTWTFIIFYLNSLQESSNGDRINDLMGFNLPQTQPQPRLQFNINTNTVCGNTDGLTKRQHQLCRQDPNAIASAIQGMQIAVHECKQQFRNNRWNCSALETRNKIPYTSAFFKTGYREAAFSHAITSAGVTHAVAHACSLGKIEACECPLHKKNYNKEIPASVHRDLRNGKNISATDPRLKQFIWGKCDYDFNFGMSYSKKFLDEREPANDFQAKLMLHNNRVGRVIVANNMKDKCICHGMSGSCSLNTCWKQTSDFKLIGRQLKQFYYNATKIELNNRAHNRFDYQLQRRLRHLDNNIHYNDQTDSLNNQRRVLGVGIMILVYYKDSPEYCKVDKSISFTGTSGRYCNRTAKSDSEGSCAKLCCSRGHRTYKVTRVEKCNCKFHWCCHVNCEKCPITERVSVCR